MVILHRKSFQNKKKLPDAFLKEEQKKIEVKSDSILHFPQKLL